MIRRPLWLDWPEWMLSCTVPGPYSRTAKPMVDACLHTGVHYLDITGEIRVFEALAARTAEAQRAGVMVLPGAGFDVVPTDCLAAHLHQRLPEATHLQLAFQGLGEISRGTTLTMLEGVSKGDGGMIRRDGKLVTVPTAWKTRTVDFGQGPRLAMTIPWGDVSTAYYTTAIPNIEVYLATTPLWARVAKLSGLLTPLLRAAPVQAFLQKRVRSGPAGPTAQERAQGRSLLWGMAEDSQGNCVASRMQTPDGYTLTVETALLIVTKVLAGAIKPGFQTPASAYGADLILEVAGVSRQDIAVGA